MGATKNLVIEEQEKKIESETMKDADYREEQWKIGPIEITFSRKYHLIKTDVSQAKLEGESFDDAVERIAWKMFQEDFLLIEANDDDFNIDIKD